MTFCYEFSILLQVKNYFSSQSMSFQDETELYFGFDDQEMMRQFFYELREKEKLLIVQQNIRLTSKLAPLQKVLDDVDFIDSLFHMNEEELKATVNADDTVCYISFQ